MAFLILFLLLIQPVLIGIYAHKAHPLGGVLWGLLAFSLNIFILGLFESRRDGRLIIDATAQIGTVVLISSIFVVGSVITLSDGPHNKATDDLAINYQKGIFRICLVVSGAWIIRCMIKFLMLCDNYGCNFSTRGHPFVLRGYIDIGEWFLEVPVAAFALGLGVCWAIEGFRRPLRKNRAETVLSLPDAVGPPEQSKED